jgi:hypothetical protein
MEDTNNDQSLRPTTPCFFPVDRQIKSAFYDVTNLHMIFLTELLSRTYVPMPDSFLYHGQLHVSHSIQLEPAKESLALMDTMMHNILLKLDHLNKNYYVN